MQDEHTTKHYDYSKAAFDRRKFFDKETNSISKILTQIGANIRGRLGKDSQQHHDVHALVLKIRGQRRITVTENSTENTISRCENSFGSRIIYFSDMITLLTGFGTDYAPINEKIKLRTMRDLLTQATTATATVSQKLAVYKPLIAARKDGFKQLSATAKRIKDMVLSQYGQDSTEYNLVKGLVI
ncbi:hypothetical protein [Flavobacterium sp.]|uniref:hypothetical protein n=1 Tax=Flavobacterium sp. TaxID=239 RepID=UPI0025F8ADE4|nr:hypothetical protein [Flavobacterium sp.]